MEEESNKNQIAVVKNNYLTKVSSTLSITNKLLTEINNRNEVPSDDFRVAIPDVNFQKYLSEELGIVVTEGTVTYGDVKNVTEIKCPNRSIESLEGIEYFTNLRYIDCSNDNLSILSERKGLKSNTNKLNYIDVSKNKHLTYLNCSGNQISILEVSHNLALENLNCALNQLSYLNITLNSSLIKLNCIGNQLSDLDISLNSSLIVLSCGGNQLRNLDLSNNLHLKELHCYKNIFTHLDISKNQKLTTVWCNDNQLTQLLLPKSIITLWCYNNNLTDLNISNCIKLHSLRCSNNQLNHLDISKCIKLERLECFDNLLQDVDTSKNRLLIGWDIENQKSEINKSKEIMVNKFKSRYPR